MLFRYSVAGSNSGHTNIQLNVLLCSLLVWVYSRMFPYIVSQDTEKSYVWMRGAIGILHTKTKYLNSELGCVSANSLSIHYTKL